MSQPETVLRIGNVSASIFVNTVEGQGGESRSFRSASLQRRYHDGQEWKSATTFSLADLPAAIEVLRLALDRIAQREIVQRVGASDDE